ncbi:hypothetical protein KKF59_00910 [Patescibacteria group bacterium]|nr:hypothetical protein [Patescibacteria group bacterium]MBU1907676.1 hypothetical protein [Patescibacteria group bacterium]
MPLKTLTKTKTSTATKVAAVTAAILLFIAAGYGFAFSFRKIQTIKTVQTPPTISYKTEPKTPVTDRPYGEIKNVAQNSPIFTNQPLEAVKPNEAQVERMLYRFKLSPLQSPAKYGKIAFKQLAFDVSIPIKVTLENFRFYIEDKNGVAEEIKQVGIKALEYPNVSHAVDVKPQSGKAVYGSSATGYRVYVTFDQELELPTFGGVYQFRANVTSENPPAGSYVSTYLVALAPEEATASTPYYTEDFGGYITPTTNSTILRTIAVGGLYNIYRFEPPTNFGIDAMNVEKKYLYHVMPTIWSDNSSEKHNIAPAFSGGSSDWYPLVIGGSPEDRLQKITIKMGIK